MTVAKPMTSPEAVALDLAVNPQIGSEGRMMALAAAAELKHPYEMPTPVPPARQQIRSYNPREGGKLERFAVGHP